MSETNRELFIIRLCSSRKKYINFCTYELNIFRIDLRRWILIEVTEESRIETWDDLS